MLIYPTELVIPNANIHRDANQWGYISSYNHP